MVEVSKDGLLPVADVDRDLFYLLRPFSPNHAHKLYGGSLDTSPEMQAIVRHRLQAERDRYRVALEELVVAADAMGHAANLSMADEAIHAARTALSGTAL